VSSSLRWLALFAVACASAPRPAAPREDEVRTEHFVFRSRFAFNEHDRLRRWALEEDRGLPCDADEGFRRAVESFRAIDEDRRAGLRIRYWLYDPALALDDSLGPVPAWYPIAMRDGEASYRRCYWDDDDRANRVWIDRAAEHIRRAEDAMVARLTRAFAIEWPREPIPVDVVPIVDWMGANTVVDPNHVLVASQHGGHDGVGAIEVVFHEASHTRISPNGGGVITALIAEAERTNVELPRDLWHAILFYTVGHATQATIRELSGEEYEMYLDSQGVLDRAWPALREPLERVWRPYLEGETTQEAAVASMCAAVGRDRGE
jgi:hypothetical protein